MTPGRITWNSLFHSVSFSKISLNQRSNSSERFFSLCQTISQHEPFLLSLSSNFNFTFPSNLTDTTKLIVNRPNVILLGDSTGDVEMANGFPALNNILKIGFLNVHVEELLPLYLEIYDIVTIKDDTFNVPNAIIKSILWSQFDDPPRFARPPVVVSNQVSPSFDRYLWNKTN